MHRTELFVSQLRRWKGRVGAAGLFLVLWFIATFYFWGDLGKWCDDWSFHLRDLVSDDYSWLTLLGRDPWKSGFWRPFNMRISSGIQTVLWHHDWLIHLILALLHGVNAWLVWKVLGRMCTSRQAPAAGALLFLVYPAGFEAIFWLSTLGTGGGVCFLLLCTLSVQRFAAGEIGWRGVLLHLPLLITIGWWYEQPAAAGPAIALAYLACLRGGAGWCGARSGATTGVPLTVRPRPFSWKPLLTAGVLGGAAMAAGLLYAVMLMATAPSHRRGGEETLTPLRELPERFAELLFKQGPHHFWFRNMMRGALDEGWQAYWSKPYQGAVLGVALIVGALAFGRWWMRTVTPEERRPFGAFERLCALGFGVAIALASLVPMAVIRDQGFSSRLIYTPAMGVLMSVAVCLDMLIGRMQTAAPAARIGRGLVLAGLLPALALWALMLVGVQSAWCKRKQQDDKVAAQLRELVPSPPAHVLFVPFEIRHWPIPARSGGGGFERLFSGPFEAPWSAHPFVQHVYRRDDVGALAYSRWYKNPQHLRMVSGYSPRGIILPRARLPGAPFEIGKDGEQVVPWSNVVGFRIIRGGKVVFINRVLVEDPSDPAGTFEVRLAPVHVPRHHRGKKAIITLTPRTGSVPRVSQH